VPGKREGQIRQEAAAGRDAYLAGRDQFIFNLGVAGAVEAVVPGLLPRDVPGFTGREGELGRLAGLAGGGSVMVAVIGGAAGVGKTALAVHAAHRLVPQFPDGQLYADLRGYTEDQAPAEAGEVLEVFLRRLGVPAEEVPAGVEERSGLLRQLLASRRVLMLLDNAATETQVRPLLPGAGGSLVLVTSRSVLPGLEVDERIGLDILAEEEATTLLARLIGADRSAAEPQAVAQVAGWCGRLPLALRISGQLLAAHPSWPVAKLADLLSGERDRLGQLAAGDLQVRAAFEVSYRLLADGDARLFRLLGLHPGPDFDVVAAASLAGTEPGTAGPVLDRLVLAHLVTEDGSGRFGMHDLLRLFARAACHGTEDQAARDVAEARLVGHYAGLAELLDTCRNPRRRPAVAQAVARAGVPLPSMREALAWFEAERPSMLAAVGLAAQRGWDEQVWQLVECMGGSLMLLRYLDELLTVRETALAAARRAADTGAEGWALHNLGEAYLELQRYEEAIGWYRESLAIFRDTGDRHGEGWALGSLGAAYVGLRRFEEAIGWYLESLAIFRDTGDRYGEGMALNNLGPAYAELRRLEEAIGCFGQSLAISRETGDRHGEGQTLNNLGLANRELRRFEEAIGCFEQSLAIARETGDRHGEGMALNNLGPAYAELRRLEEAIGCFEQSLAIFRDTGDRHGEGLALIYLGSAYQALRQPDRAAACWRGAAAAMREAGSGEAAAGLEQLAANAQSRRRRWRRSS
jgi:tetratricopeptide (TPR) repeat protein